MSGPENENNETTRRSTRSKADASTDESSAASSGESASSVPPTAQATAAVSNAVSTVRERLVTGEQLALVGAGLVAAVWIIFDLIFAYGTMTTFTLLVAVLAVLAIWAHRWGRYDFGPGYRIVVAALGLSLALFAVTDFLLTIRNGINAEALELLGLLLFWVGGVVAGYGAWLVFRAREI